MLLNKNFPQIIFGEIKYNTIGISRYLEMYDFKTSETLYWYIEVDNIHSLTDEVLDKVLPKAIIPQLVKGNVKLAIVNAFEAKVSIVKVIYENVIIKRGIPESNILLLSQNYSILDIVRSIAKEYNREPVRTIWTNVAEFNTALQLHNAVFGPIKSLPQKRYLCLNRRWRPHRPTLVGLLESKNLLSHGYVSLISMGRENWTNSFDWAVDFNKDNVEVVNLLNSNRDRIMSLPELSVDLESLDDYMRIFGLQDSIKPYYNSTLFSVITETNFYDTPSLEPGIYFTEKTYKPIFHRHPFILAGPKGSLKVLRDRGYRTFHPFFDESYDLEENDATRILMIANEIERLCNMPIDELETLIDKCKDICNHNYEVLYSAWPSVPIKLDK